jgi:hypothetical protein
VKSVTAPGKMHAASFVQINSSFINRCGDWPCKLLAPTIDQMAG